MLLLLSLANSAEAVTKEVSMNALSGSRIILTLRQPILSMAAVTTLVAVVLHLAQKLTGLVFQVTSTNLSLPFYDCYVRSTYSTPHMETPMMEWTWHPIPSGNSTGVSTLNFLPFVLTRMAGILPLASAYDG